MDNRIEVEKDRDKYLIDISDDDVLQAMKEIGGYLDITFGDFKDLYHIACSHALKRLMHSVKAVDIMTENVISVHGETPAKEIAQIMAERNVSGLPVVDDKEHVVGIISEKDFLFRMGKDGMKSIMSIITECLGNRACLAAPIRKQKAADIMTSPVISVSENTSVVDIVNLFAEKNINRVPVISQEMRLVGIVSRADALQTVIPRVKG